MRTGEYFSESDLGIENEALETEEQKIREGLEEFEEEIEDLSFFSGKFDVIRGEYKEEGSEKITFFIAQPKSTWRDNKFIVAKSGEENLILVSTPRKIHTLHQDIFDMLQKHIDNLECIGGGEIRLEPISLYGSSEYGNVPRKILERIKKGIERKLREEE